MKVMKRMAAVLAAAALFGTAVLTGCATTSAAAGARGTDKEILVVSFGTSYNSSRSLTIGGIENCIREHFPDYRVERAFTADTIIRILKKRDNIKVDTVKEALDKAVASGVGTLVVQPTHLMMGFEYADLKAVVDTYKDKFDKLVLAAPLLTDSADYEKVVAAIRTRTASLDDGETAICFMGHGTEAESNKDYQTMQRIFAAKGYANYYVGTVEASPTVDDLVEAIDAKGTYSNVVLLPLMVVAGDHATNDMAGDEEDSWKSVFERAGYGVTCVLEGLGQNYDIQKIYVEHTQAAIDSLR